MAQWNKINQEFLSNNKTLFEVNMLADKDGNPINSFGAASNIPIASGDVTGWKSVHKFGRNPNIGGIPETIWMHGGVYAYLSSPSTLYTHSASALDVVDGTGARTLTIQGLDVNFNEIEETVTVNSDVATTKEFLRVTRAFIATAGELTTNKDVILISTAVDGGGTVLADIGLIGSGTTVGLGQTQLALYTIPAGYTGYLTTWNVGVAAYNKSITAQLLARELDGGAPFRTRDILDCAGGHNTVNYPVPHRFPQKTDIEIRAAGDTGAVVSSSFDIILVANPA